jgi:hypothetical protein
MCQTSCTATTLHPQVSKCFNILCLEKFQAGHLFTYNYHVTVRVVLPNKIDS